MLPKIYRSASILGLIAILVAGCASPAPANQAKATVTPASTSSANPTPTTPVTETPILPTVQVNCKDSALYVKDISIPDNTKLKPGEAFTKTWQVRNTGTCIWNVRYALVFVGGEQMGAKVTTPLAETPPDETLDVSIDLTAPTKPGAYTALFELRNPQGRALDIGAVTSIWVKIMVDETGAASSLASATATASSDAGAASIPAQACKPEQNAETVAQVLSLINDARAKAKLTPLKLSGKLSFAAQGHSDDMACNNFVSHSGSDGSTAQERMTTSGYAASYYGEVIYASGTPQDAVKWWLSEKAHSDIILSSQAVDIGIGYSFLPDTSAYGSYYTVNVAAP
jgi:uncharacterized protein YkwD